MDEQHKYVWEVNDVATGVTYPGKRNRRAMKEYFKTRAITSFPGWKVSCKGGISNTCCTTARHPSPLCMCLQLAVLVTWLSRRHKLRADKWPLLRKALEARKYKLPE